MSKELLQDREKTYGNYLDQCMISYGIKYAMFGEDAPDTEMMPDQRDALEMIAVKLSRIINGNPDYADTWRDIAGYATLVADRLEGETHMKDNDEQ